MKTRKIESNIYRFYGLLILNNCNTYELLVDDTGENCNYLGLTLKEQEKVKLAIRDNETEINAIFLKAHEKWYIE